MYNKVKEYLKRTAQINPGIILSLLEDTEEGSDQNQVIELQNQINSLNAKIGELKAIFNQYKTANNKAATEKDSAKIEKLEIDAKGWYTKLVEKLNAL